MSYDPGTATMATRQADGTYLVDSFRGQEAAYIINLEAGTCTCPHFTNRLVGTGQDCKHLRSVRAQAVFSNHIEKARSLSDGDLGRLLTKYANDPLVGGALRVARAERQQVAA